MEITIRSHKLLRALGFNPVSKDAYVGLDHRDWLAVIWSRVTGRK